jgi:hypothetical protein
VIAGSNNMAGGEIIGFIPFYAIKNDYVYLTLVCSKMGLNS